MTTLDQDVKIVSRIIERRDKKALRDICDKFLPEYYLQIYAKLNPWDKKFWGDIIGIDDVEIN